MPIVSFDIFLQRFKAGDGVDGGAEEALDVLRPYLVDAPHEGFAAVRTIDGEAEVYGLDTGSLMITEVAGEAIWDLIFDVAFAADHAILAFGRPVCLVDAALKEHLPAMLSDPVVVVTSGRDLLAVVQSRSPAGEPVMYFNR
jgi:hypothetical protein